MNFKNELLNLLKSDSKEKVIAIKGVWGSGKSTFWKGFIEDKAYYNNAYISLYGLKSIEDIENSILLQISDLHKLDGFIEKRLNFLREINIYGMNAKAILSSIKPKDFCKLIICLDDFERLSNKISINELFGFIADLKENKHCKVVMILNEDKINESNKNDFNIQQEKIIDYELFFQQNLDEIDIIPKKEYKDILYEFIKKYEVQNIRTINKIINILNKFLLKLDNNMNVIIRENILKKVIEISFVYYQFNFKDFNQLVKYRSEKVSKSWYIVLKNKNQLKNDEETNNKLKDTEKFIENNKELEEYIKYLENFHFEDLEKSIIDFITKHIWDEKKIFQYIENEKYNLDNNNLRDKLNDIIEKYYFDFNYTLEKYDQELFDFLNKYKENILKLKNFETIKKEVEICKLFSSNCYDTLLTDIGKSYLENFEYKNYHGNISNDTNFQQIKKENNPVVMAYLESLICYDKNPTSETIIKIFEKAINTNNVIQISETNTVNNLSENVIKNFILNDKKFVKILEDNFNRHSNFPEFIDKVSNVFNDLKSNENYKRKIEELESRVL